MLSKLRRSPVLCVGAALAVLGAASCGKPAPEAAAVGASPSALAPETWAGVAGRFVDSAGKQAGEAVLVDAKDGVLLRLRVEGLTPGWHGAHLHMVGDCADASAGFKTSGAHFDPENHEHGLENPGGSERGDLPNIFAGNDGRATVEFYRANLNINPSEAGAATNGPYPLLDDDGFAILIHANPDDHVSQPIGGAGDRVLCAAFGG